MRSWACGGHSGSNERWRKLTDALLAEHAELDRTKDLTPAGFQRRRDKEQAEAARRLEKLVNLENATHVGPAALARLRDAVGGGIDDAQVRQALAAAGITVVDQLPELPAAPPPSYAELGLALRTLDLNLSAEIVFGPQAVRTGFQVLDGFRLTDGRRLDEAALNAAARQSSELAHSNPRKRPTETLLTVLQDAYRSGTLDQLLLWEVMELLRPQVGHGFGQKMLANQAAEFGLDRDEAGILAAAMLAEAATEGLRRRIEENLAAGRLRSAQLQAAGLPDDDELRTRLDAAAAEVASLDAKADAELAAGRTESAAQLFAAAAARATDDENLPKRLAGVAPPPPQAATAVVDGNRVVVSWQASAARAGRVRYRVTRDVGRAPGSPAEGVVITPETGELHAADESPPHGADLYYSVFAGRGGPQWSPAAGTPQVVFAPEVTGVALDVTADAVRAVWPTPPGASEVRVVREAGGSETKIESDMTGFNDTGLTAGVEYLYRITAVYRAPDGSAVTSAPVAVRGTPIPRPVPVGTLEVHTSTPVIEVSWEPPPHGRVELLLSRTPPPWPSGVEPDQADLAGFGRQVPGTPQPAASGRVSSAGARANRTTLPARGHPDRPAGGGRCPGRAQPRRAGPRTHRAAAARQGTPQLDLARRSGRLDRRLAGAGNAAAPGRCTSMRAG